MMNLGAATPIDLACGEIDIWDPAPSSGGSVDETDRASSGPVALTLDDAKVVAAWCRRYGVTLDQLTLATTLVGRMPAALHFYLTSRGRPTKIVTDEMRASRAPIRPRDRRRTPIADPVAGPIVAAPVVQAPTDIEALRLERSLMELNVRIAADALHERPSPATIRAYDEAQELLDAAVTKLDGAETSQRSVVGGFTLKDGMP